MSSSSKDDVYDRVQDFIPLENIANRLVKSDKDESISELKEACNKAVDFLTEDEVNLLFFRFFQNASYKTLKKNISIGSTKTAAKRIRRLSSALKAYIVYHRHANFADDIKMIVEKTDREGGEIAEYLFRRWSRSKIVRKGSFKVTRRRLENQIDNIRFWCEREPSLFYFWEVITTIGKI